MTKQKWKIIFAVIAFICAVCLIFTVIAILPYIPIPEPDAGDNNAINVSAKNDVNFDVYYLENQVFGIGAQPRDLSYLMSFTDYIQIENSFSANFSQEFDTTYSYSATETLVIKNQRSNEGENPVVYEEGKVLSEMTGSIVESNVLFSGKGAPGGIYTIYPKRYISIYRQFVEEQQALMTQEGIIADRALGFSAELVVEFTYHIKVDEIGINETLKRGCSIPLSGEVYSLADIGGAPSFESSVPVSILEPELKVNDIEVPSAILFVLWSAMHILGFCFSIRQLTMENNVYRREIKKILNKYSDEIIITMIPLDVSNYKVMPVASFKELLKLAVNTGRQINCYQNDENAEFYAISERQAYCFHIRDEATPITTVESYSAISEIKVRDVIAEAEELLSEMDIFMEVSAIAHENLQVFANLISKNKEKLKDVNLLKKLHGYKNIADAARSVSEKTPIQNKETGDFMKKLGQFVPRLQLLIDEIEESESLHV